LFKLFIANSRIKEKQ